MIREILILAACLGMTVAAEKVEIPTDIATALSTSAIGENGGFGVRGVDEAELRSYIKSNWREIATHIESLPLRVAPGGFIIASKEQAFNGTVANFAAACESLPPLEYLDFLDQFLSLHENKRISFHPIETALTGVNEKRDFLAVNWEHSRVQAICSKALELIPTSKVSYRELFESIATGELADNYLPDQGVDLPPPELLPGIKLQRPFASLIGKYEQLTGKKFPHDPKFNPRPTRRGEATADPRTGAIQAQAIWPWLAGLMAVLATAFSVWKLRSSRLPVK